MHSMSTAQFNGLFEALQRFTFVSIHFSTFLMNNKSKINIERILLFKAAAEGLFLVNNFIFFFLLHFYIFYFGVRNYFFVLSVQAVDFNIKNPKKKLGGRGEGGGADSNDEKKNELPSLHDHPTYPERSQKILKLLFGCRCVILPCNFECSVHIHIHLL